MNGKINERSKDIGLKNIFRIFYGKKSNWFFLLFFILHIKVVSKIVLLEVLGLCVGPRGQILLQAHICLTLTLSSYINST